MADPKSNDTPSPDPKAGKSAAVKPPVLEGKARPADAQGKPAPETAKSDNAASAAASGSAGDKTGTTTTASTGSASTGPDSKAEAKPAARPEPVTGSKPASATPPANQGSNAWIAGIAGGIIGLGAAYGLAYFGYWPERHAAEQAADPRIAQSASAIPELQTVTSTVQSELSTLTQRVATLEQAEPAASQPQDDTALSDVQSQLAALSDRVDALGNAATAQSGGDTSGANAAAIVALEAGITKLQQQTDALSTQMGSTTQRLDALNTTVTADAQSKSTEARLPLILSGLETAFDTGRPYEAELSALRTALPDVTIPEAVSAHASEGLPRPDDVMRRFETVLPDILAGRPANTDASWQDNTADWFRGLIALRPAEAVDGTGPDAIVARAEAAVQRRDFLGAQEQLQSLPAAMLTAAGPVAGDIDTLAGAQKLLVDLRAAALKSGGGA